MHNRNSNQGRPNFIPPPPMNLPTPLSYYPQIYSAVPSPPPPPESANLIKNFIPLNSTPFQDNQHIQLGGQRQFDGNTDQKVFTSESNEIEGNSKFFYSWCRKEEQQKVIVLKDLNANTSEADIREVFAEFGEIESVFLEKLQSDDLIGLVCFRSSVVHHFDQKGQFYEQDNIIPFSHSGLRDILSPHSQVYQKFLNKMENPENFARFLSKPKKALDGLNYIMARQPLAYDAHTIRVRELWISNLDIGITEDYLRQVFGQFGQIELVNLYKKDKAFAAVRFSKVEQAEEVINRRNDLKQLTDSINLSDFLKRDGIVGDNQYITGNENQLTHIVFVATESNKPIPKKSRILEHLSEIGVTVKNMTIRNSVDPKLRHFCVIELSCLEDALKVRDYYHHNDQSYTVDNRRKRSFNDFSAEVNILLKPNINGEFTRFLKDFLRKPDINLDSLVLDDEQYGLQERRKSSMIELTTLDDNDFVWTGFLTQFRKDQAGIDIYNYIGDVRDSFVENMFNIDIGMRLPLEDLEGESFDKIAIIKLSHEIYWYKFELHMDYLAENNQYGVISHIDGYNVYIVPYCDFSKKLYSKLEKTECLALFKIVDSFDPY